MTPFQLYQQKTASAEIQPDPAQIKIMLQLDQLAIALNKQSKKIWGKPKSVKGIYLWGNVGVGKSFLMNCFYEALSIPKLRMHFHAFMQDIHQQLTRLQGQKNPLSIIAKEISTAARVICFDEFFVTNIADAMLLGGLFEALFSQGITLVTSSNIPPDLLYKEGLQRDRFLPAIELIKSHTAVMHLHSHHDYRRMHIEQAGVFYFPENAAAEKHMDNCFVHFSRGASITTEPVNINHREIHLIKKAASVIWFSFETICGKPRAPADYLSLVKNFHTIMISGIRTIHPAEKDLILNFIYLIDILYDAHCRLILSSAVALDAIYPEGIYQQTFERTLSRLIEMQSKEYVYPNESDALTTI